MIEGHIKRSILLFALPIFLGQLMQQLYNIADSIIVGKCINAVALAAVSATGSLIFLFTGFVQGLFVGMGVIIGIRFGAEDYKALSKAAHTGVAFGFIAGFAMTVAGVALTPWVLELMGTPDDVMGDAVLYLRIFFIGGIFSVVYNTCCGVFQAVGDSRHPLYYLVISSILNIALDMLFIMVLGIGIAGAAIATVIAQLVAALLAFTKLLRVDGPHRISIKEIKIDVSMLKDELALGIPSGIQNSVISLANVIVQANINAFDSLAMAGCGSYSKLEGFAFLPIVSFAMALTTFVSQNIGARQYDRARSGARFGILSGVIGAEIIGAIMFIFAPFFISFFSDDPEVIAFGVKQAHVECLFYCLLSYNHTMAGVLRGAGKTKVPMAVMLICWCLIRITYITIAVRLVPVITTIFIAYPLTWSLSAILFTIYYLKVKVLRDPRENVKI